MLAKVKNAVNKYKYKALAAISFIAAGYFFYQYTKGEWEVKLSSFLQALQMGEITEVLFEGETLFFRSKNSDWYRTCIGKFSIEQIFRLLTYKNIVFSTREAVINDQILQLGVSTVLSCVVFKYYFNTLHQTSSNGSLKTNIYDNGGSLDDFYGGDKIKEKLEQTIDFLHDPEKYEKMGARIRRGVLFYGPPGTGKTMLARALAAESGCEFIKTTASEFVQIFAGVGPKRVRELFQTARRTQKGCIIFIDEIDALGSRLNDLRNNHQTTSTINQFLSEMDGFSPTQKVVVVAATNRLDLVDHAILRSGRFDIKVHIQLPDRGSRVGIFKKILERKLKNLHEVDEDMVEFIGNHSEGWCGADLQTLVNESIYIAIRENVLKVDSFHIQQAYDELVCRRK